jgi:hypothetical protein
VTNFIPDFIASLNGEEDPDNRLKSKKRKRVEGGAGGGGGEDGEEEEEEEETEEKEEREESALAIPPPPLGAPPPTPSRLSLVWPSAEAVRTCNEGWAAGDAFPGEVRNLQLLHDKGVSIFPFTSSCGRGSSAPHCKFFLRYCPSSGALRWVLFGSHNLSPGALGRKVTALGKSRTTNCEASVVLTPSSLLAGCRAELEHVREGRLQESPFTCSFPSPSTTTATSSSSSSSSSSSPAAPADELPSQLFFVPEKLFVGSRLLLVGLRSRPELNGREVHVKSFIPASGRYRVALEAPPKETLDVLPSCLSPVPIREGVERVTLRLPFELPCDAMPCMCRAVPSVFGGSLELQPFFKKGAWTAEDVYSRKLNFVMSLSKSFGTTTMPDKLKF